MLSRTRPASRAGMTLIEIMVAVSLIAMMSSLAIPKITAVRDQLSLEAAAQELVHQLHLARSEAIKRNQPTSFYKINDSTFNVGTLSHHTLPGDVVFASTAPDSVRYASFGPPVTGAATIPIQIGSRTKTVRVNAAGYASY
jgi:prepilin-type N-terminal cleavage/methylation domain-containing protein